MLHLPPLTVLLHKSVLPETSVTELSKPSRSEIPDTETSRRKAVEAPPRKRRKNPGVMTEDQLIATWNRVGSQIHKVTLGLFLKQEKVGDGSYLGFVNGVLEKVPNVSTVEEGASSFGYLIYTKTVGSSRMVTVVRPGDIIVLQIPGLLKFAPNLRPSTLVVGIISEFNQRSGEITFYQTQEAGNQVGHTMSRVSAILMRPFS